GAVQRASRVDDVRMHRAVVARFAKTLLPAPVPAAAHTVHASVAAVAPVPAKAPVQTGRVDQRGFSINRHPAMSHPPLSLREDATPEMIAEAEALFRLPVGVPPRGGLGVPSLPSQPFRPPSTAGLPPSVVAAMDRAFAQLHLEASSHGTQMGAASAVTKTVFEPVHHSAAPQPPAPQLLCEPVQPYPAPLPPRGFSGPGHHQHLPPRGFQGQVHYQHHAQHTAPPPSLHGYAPPPPPPTYVNAPPPPAAYGTAPPPTYGAAPPRHPPAYGNAPPPPPPPPPAYGVAPSQPPRAHFGGPGAPPPPPPPPPPAYGGTPSQPAPVYQGAPGAPPPPPPPPPPHTYAAATHQGAAAAFNPGPQFPPLPPVAGAAALARIGCNLNNLKIGLLPQLPPLPLHDPSSVFEFVQLNNVLRRSVHAIRAIAGDTDPDRWHPDWLSPFQRHVQGAVRNVQGNFRIVVHIDNAFASVSIKVKEGVVAGPASLELLLKELAPNFSSINPAHVSIMLANFHVPANTTFKAYLVELKVVAGGVMHMGHFNPGLMTIIEHIKCSLSNQFPSVLLFFQAALNGHFTTIEQVWDVFEEAKNNTTLACPAPHLTSAPSHSFQPRTANSKPRVMTVADGNFYEVLDNAHEVEIEDEEEWTQVYSVAQGSARSKFTRLFKHAFDSEESKAARRCIGRRCMNCASENHFLRTCDRDYLNHFEQFADEFGAGSKAEVNERWHTGKGRMRTRYEQNLASRGSPNPYGANDVGGRPTPAAHSAVLTDPILVHTTGGPSSAARCLPAGAYGIDSPVPALLSCPPLPGEAIALGTKCSECIDPSETGAVRSVMPCRGTGRPSETGVVRSVAQ
ncbi:unnamed protein product, partial [Laminaria digitata]